MKQQYTITVDLFNGPLDLLLHLIERDELDITSISLAKVTHQYLAQVEEMKENKVGQMIDFIVIGARLMVIKSRALLPTPPVQLEGEEMEEDPAEQLIRQLKLYKQFKGAVEYLNERLTTKLRTYLRVAPPSHAVETQLDLQNVDAYVLWERFGAIKQRLAEQTEGVAVMIPRKLTIEGQIERLRAVMVECTNINFKALLSDQVTLSELSVTFLAVLESIKRQEIGAEQGSRFGPITIEKYRPQLILSNDEI